MWNKLAEAQYLGKIDEKIRCGVGHMSGWQGMAQMFAFPGSMPLDSNHHHIKFRFWLTEMINLILHSLWIKGDDDDNEPDGESDGTKTASCQHTSVSRYVAYPVGDISFFITYKLLEYISYYIGHLLQPWDCYHNNYELFWSISRIIPFLACILHAYIGLFQLHDKRKSLLPPSYIFIQSVRSAGLLVENTDALIRVQWTEECSLCDWPLKYNEHLLMFTTCTLAIY